MPSHRPAQRAALPGDPLGRDVLRYWLALLVYEEALAVRPRARRPTGPPLAALDVQQPVAGQDYAKLPFAGAEAFLVERRGRLRVELREEWLAFFEDWLAARYRRGGGESQLDQLVLFPTLHTARGELAGLLRFPVRVEWRVGESPFEVPGYERRKRREWPDPPTALVLEPSEEVPPGELPFFLDQRLLQETLCIDAEAIADFSGAVREHGGGDGAQAIQALSALIEGQCRLEDPSPRAPASGQPVPPRPTPAEVLERLCAAIAQRLAQLESRARVYGIALVVNHSQPRVTWNLQRDIKAALALLEGSGLDRAAPLRSYLGVQVAPRREATCWGRWRGAGLTESQRAAAELALGSSLSAVQGPPGTGKTTLILNLLAHTLVRKVTALARDGTMGRGVTVVTSTNNRAVDNVVDPLGRELPIDQLPLSLRVGSRQVFEKVTLIELERTRRWLESQRISGDGAEPTLSGELERFRALRSELEAPLAASEAHRARAARLQEVDAELQRLRSAVDPDAARRGVREALHALGSPTAGMGSLLSDASVGGALPGSSLSGLTSVQSAIEAFARRLAALSQLAEGRGQAALTAVRSHWSITRKKPLAKLARVLGFDPVFALPPTPMPSMVEDALAAWEEGAEAALLLLSDLEQALTAEQGRAARHKQLLLLEQERETLEGTAPEVAPPIDGPLREALDRRHLELFESAVRVREAWASLHRAELLAAIAEATKTIQAARSLRPLIEARGDASRWLRELFPAWGCTLLSLGNVFPAEERTVQTVVIDEAGQCHPAYAAAALLRAESALVIGDVNQLEPVVGLSSQDEHRVLRGLKLRSTPEELEPFRAFDASGTSAQSVADRSVALRPTLTDHFRCQPEIAAICEALCGYGLTTRTPTSTRADLAPWLGSAVLHVPAEGHQERFGGSLMNEAEVMVALELVRELLGAGLRPGEIGVITPYRGQLERLWRALRQAGVPLERPWADLGEAEELNLFHDPQPGLVTGTVHRFQGGERSVIIFSTTVTERRSLEFLNGRVNLVNVAASRARDHLITLGHTATLLSGRHTRYLVARATRVGDRSATDPLALPNKAT